MLDLDGREGIDLDGQEGIDLDGQEGIDWMRGYELNLEQLV